jgi:uncharacterized protein (TIGR02391 family)
MNQWLKTMVRDGLPRQMLHPLLRTSVWTKFAAGNYDSAIRDAFVILEQRVKTTSGLKGEIGVPLMRAAFDPRGGVRTLTDMNLPLAERQRMADLFVGAIATFRDPLSHRMLSKSSASSVIEVLKFASELLGYLPPAARRPRDEA